MVNTIANVLFVIGVVLFVWERDFFTKFLENFFK